MSARAKFIIAMTELLGQPVVWGGLDCSESVALGVLAASGGKLDQRKTHRAQTYFNETRPLMPLERAMPGDLVFYGVLPADPTSEAGARIHHVAVILENGKVLSADGATVKQQDPAVAAADQRARVRVHETVHFRHDLFVSIHRNTIVDSIDFVER